MNIQVYEKGDRLSYLKDTLYLRRDNWDDYSFRTTFDVSYFSDIGTVIPIGQVKIGIIGMEPQRKIVSNSITTIEPAVTFNMIPKQFSTLNETFFSLGQDENYYANISGLGDSKRIEILTALQDVAFNLDHFQKVSLEKAMRTSLMRGIGVNWVKEQLHRIANGGAKLTKYNFTYTIQPREYISSASQLSFAVDPHSNPPTNIHVLIGRNGTGKTTLIKNMIRSIRYNDNSYGVFEYAKVGRSSTPAMFSNILCVAFSPFDDFTEVELQGESDIPYSYIGLNKQEGNLFHSIEKQFLEAFSSCMMNSRKRMLWLKAIEILKSDVTFMEMSLESVTSTDNFARDGHFDTSKAEHVKQIFSNLSSGHKVVLLIVTCCVDKIVEKSIVFMDEPENHLHPPLLSALIRALSDLLIDRNGVAIISTHSPVVLQEVPSCCVYSIRRLDQELVSERLPLETFGASIGSLTNEVFGLEVTSSGYHKLLSEAVKTFNDYDMISCEFDNQLGNEAIMLLRTLLALHRPEDE